MRFLINWAKYINICFHQIGMVFKFKPCQIMTIKDNRFYKLEFVTCTCKHNWPDFSKKTISTKEGQQGASDE